MTTERISLYYGYTVHFTCKNKEMGYLGQCTAFIQQRDVHNVPDCKIGLFEENLCLRTRQGMKKKSYKNENTMRLAIEKTLKNQLGAYNFSWVENTV